MRSNVIAASERGETTQPRSRGGQLRPVLVGVRVCHFDIEDNSSLQINQVIVRKGEGQMTVGQNTSVAAFDAFAAAQTTEAAARRDELIASVVPVPGPTRNWGRLSVAQLATVGAEGDTAFATDGLKVGDTTGNGGGVPVYKSQGEWRTHNNDAQVAS
jgi:hypothetical protein